MRHYAGFAEHQRLASEHGIELYLLEHADVCTFGKYNSHDCSFTYCNQPALVNTARWFAPNGWRCENACEKHLNALLGIKAVNR